MTEQCGVVFFADGAKRIGGPAKGSSVSGNTNPLRDPAQRKRGREQAELIGGQCGFGLFADQGPRSHIETGQEQRYPDCGGARVVGE